MHNSAIRRIQLLEGVEGVKLGLIKAPAGYGKTHLLKEWAQAHPSAWFSIDQYDNTPEQFANYLISSIAQLGSFPCPASMEMVKQSHDLDLITLFTLLFHETAHLTASMSLILDDFQHINNAKILQAIHFFIKHMPNHWQLLISSRIEIPLPISNLRMQQQLFEVNVESLAFSEQECALFFAQKLHFSLTQAHLKQLNDSVSGWPMALQLVTMLSKDEATFSAAAEQVCHHGHVYLWDYFDEEVFNVFPENLQNLLLRMAPFSKVNAALIEQLCPNFDGLQLLARLGNQGYLFTASKDSSDWFTCSDFLKQFLRHKSQKSNINLLTDIEIATIWLASKQADQALIHVLRSRDTQITITFLQQAGWALFNDGQFNQLQACFDILKQAIWLHPEFVILKAWMLQSHHQHYKVAPLIKQSEKMFRRHKVILSVNIVNELQVIKAQIAINQGRVKDALAQAQKALLSPPSNSTRMTIIAQTIIAEAYHCLGRLPVAYQYFQEVLTLAHEQGMHQSISWILYQQAEILQAQCQHKKAQQHLQSAEHLIENQHLSALPLSVFPLHFRVRSAYHRGQFELAEQLCEQALDVLSHYDEQWLLYTYTLQTQIALQQQQPIPARQLIVQIERLLRNQNYHSDWIAAANHVRLRYWESRDDFYAIERWLQQAPTPHSAVNHFDQCHQRNLIHAYLSLGRLNEAQQQAQKSLADAQHSQLQQDVNRDLILLACIEAKLQHHSLAKEYLRQALELALYTQLDGCFIEASNRLKPIYEMLARDNTLAAAVNEKLLSILSLSDIHLTSAPHNPFDSRAVRKITRHQQTPRLVKNISLTPREWQVFGFIHSGCRNHEIARNMGVAPTTIKSHIRHVYQKFGLENRKQALQLSEQLITLI